MIPSCRAPRYTSAHEDNMAESQLQVLTATQSRQCVLEGFHLNGVQYQVDNGDLGWHVTASPGRDPVNVYWVAGNKFFMPSRSTFSLILPRSCSSRRSTKSPSFHLKRRAPSSRPSPIGRCSALRQHLNRNPWPVGPPTNSLSKLPLPRALPVPRGHFYFS